MNSNSKDQIYDLKYFYVDCYISIMSMFLYFLQLRKYKTCVTFSITTILFYGLLEILIKLAKLCDYLPSVVIYLAKLAFCFCLYAWREEQRIAREVSERKREDNQGGNKG